MIFVLSAGVLLFTWIGYPIWVRLLAVASTKNDVATGDTRMPRVSVVLATLDGDEAVVARVRDIFSGNYPTDRLDVVVAFDAKRASQEVAFPFDEPSRVLVVRGDAPGGKAAALNAGVRAATGEVLVFTDTAQRFEASAIPRLVAALQRDPRAAAVSGALSTSSASSGRLSIGDLYWRYERWLRFWEARLHSSVGVTGAVYAMHRALWVPLPPGLILDDLFTPMHAVMRGHRIGFDATARAVDDRRFRPEDEYRRKVRTLTGVLQLCAWLPGVLVPWRNPVWFQFMSHKLLRLLTPYLLLICAASGTVWIAARFGRTVALLAVCLPLGAVLVAAVASRRLGDAVWGLVLMQAAIVRATLNAARGEWDVWQR